MVLGREDDELSVLLGDTPVGTLRRTRSDAVEFILLESYKAAQLRPVLGQQFLDDPELVRRVRSRVPDWFSNLLPEGALRDLIAQQAGVPAQREFILLRHLGQDLPGAVRMVSSQAELALASDLPVDSAPDISSRGEWHFSLAGVQLKFSARESERGLTIPVSGTGGNWIVKLPDRRYADVPVNEHATMSWARASGIDVPDNRLVAVDEIEGLPEHLYRDPERTAYAVRRFDRGPENARVHIEDFAQVLALFPEEKYRKYNYETIANVIAALDGERGLSAFVRRLVFMVASGNGDAHHKNWSLIYPDGVAAQLAPAYDLVSTIQYNPYDQMALNLGRSKAWEDVSFQSFERLAGKIGWPGRSLRLMVEEAVQSIREGWLQVGRHAGYTREAVDRLEQHMRVIPVMQS